MMNGLRGLQPKCNIVQVKVKEIINLMYRVTARSLTQIVCQKKSMFCSFVFFYDGLFDHLSSLVVC